MDHNMFNGYKCNFKREYLPDEDPSIVNTSLVDFMQRLIGKVQRSQLPEGEAYLSFYPIAKNVRFVSSYMFQNMINMRRSRISDRCRADEGNFFRTYLNLGDINPWLWSRIDDKRRSNTDAWSLFFRDIRDTDTDDTLVEEDKIFIAKNMSEMPFRMCLLSQLTIYSFRLSDAISNYIDERIKEMNWNKDVPMIGLHIRRGECTTSDLSKTDRPAYSLEEYMKNVEILSKKYGITSVYISTDSKIEIERAVKEYPQYEWYYLHIDRDFFYLRKEQGGKLNSFNKPEIQMHEQLECVAAKNPHLIEPLVKSALADLFFLSYCNAYVATITISEYSKLGWYLMMGRNGFIPPYIDMYKDIDIDKRDMFLLL